MEDNIINVDEALRDIENFLRNNIMYILKNKYGDKWENNLGVSAKRIGIWKNRMEDERKRLNDNVIENRLLYYSDFYDLKTIISKNWDIFKECFSSKSIMENQLSQLESFRNPNAHNRDLYDYQKHLLIGYIGEIKAGIMKYRGSIEKVSTFFPVYESLNINGEKINLQWAHLNKIFRPGDQITIAIYVTSPNTQKLYYCIKEKPSKKYDWSENNTFEIQVDNHQFGVNRLYIYYKSDSNYHLNGEYDGTVPITYMVVDND